MGTGCLPWGDENVLKLDSNDGCQTPWYKRKQWNVHLFKRVNFMACELYKAVLKFKKTWFIWEAPVWGE